MRFLDAAADPDLEIPRPDEMQEPIEAVREILAKVRAEGDRALVELTERFDRVRLEGLQVPGEEIEKAHSALPFDLKEALNEAAKRIRSFSERQALRSWHEEIGGGLLGEKVHPVARAGLYVPGGRAAYPSTVLMTAIPAEVAGVEEVVLFVPPGEDGSVPAATLGAAHLAGVTDVYRVGGAQAIAAMAYGTDSIRKVDVIVGPGNIYVALAKREVAGTVGIDSVAGPSEIAIVTDGSLDPRVAAFDLVAQAEHGPSGSFVLVTWKEEFLVYFAQALEAVLSEIEASDQLRDALDRGCLGVAVNGVEQAAECINRFAPEHLQLVFDGAEDELERFRTAGATFVGPWSPVCLGDYFAGTNHVLPTGGAGRWASGLRTSHFQRATSFVVYGKEALEAAAGRIDVLAGAEGLPNHGRAVRARLQEEGEGL
ncbi:MAG: histidinol dehydrogenase [Actinomycetota bacterium]|nr:histidinol dehydrogenase [Actinomycetota bacterium]